MLLQVQCGHTLPGWQAIYNLGLNTSAAEARNLLYCVKFCAIPFPTVLDEFLMKFAQKAIGYSVNASIIVSLILSHTRITANGFEFQTFARVWPERS